MLDKLYLRRQLGATVESVLLRLEVEGVLIPDDLRGYKAAPRRDKREPGRREKEEAEDALMLFMMRRFRRQARILKERLAMVIKAVPFPLDDIFEPDSEEVAELIRLLMMNTRNGVTLFMQATGVGIDYSLTNVQAAEWARRYAGELIKGIDATTLDTVRRAVEMFVDTPGFTIGDVMGMLPFDEQRALRIATTEITRSYAQGQLIAGEEMRAQFPEVKVKKQWFTNADSLVCEMCGPLNGMEVDFDTEFYSVDSIYQDGNPPRHPSCRCWMTTYTALADLTPQLDYSPTSIPDAMQAQMNHPMYNVDKQERVFIYDDNGNVLFDKWGDKDGVDFKLDDRFKNGQLLHNHPPERMGPTIWDTDTLTFSKSDIELAYKQDLSRIVATGQKETFMMERPLNGWGDFDKSYLQTVKNLATNKEYADIVTNYRYELANIPMSEKNEMSKKLWREFAKVTNAIYKEIRK